MTNSQLHRVLKEIGEEIVPAETDLWPKIYHQLRTEEKFPPIENGIVTQLRRSVQNFKFAFAAACFVLIAVVFLSFTNPGRAFAQSVLRFFQQASTNILPAPTAVPTILENSEDEGQASSQSLVNYTDLLDVCLHQTASCSTAEIRKFINLPFKEISILPEGFVFDRIIGKPDNFSSIFVETGPDALLVLDQKMLKGETVSPIQQIGSSATVESVEVGESIGEYVSGGFIYSKDDSWMEWENRRITQTLVWVQDGVMYRLSYSGETLTKENLIDMASHISSDVNHARENSVVSAESGTDPQFNLRVKEAEGVLGYSLFQPAPLPENLSLIGVSIDPSSSMATTKYGTTIFGSTESGNGLLVQQWDQTTSTSNPLPELVIGDLNKLTGVPRGTVVEAFEQVKIGGLEGQYVVGTWVGTDCCGWKWEPTPYLKRLRWQTEERSFELLFMGMPDTMSKDELISIAENLKP